MIWQNILNFKHQLFRFAINVDDIAYENVGKYDNHNFTRILSCIADDINSHFFLDFVLERPSL